MLAPHARVGERRGHRAQELVTDLGDIELQLDDQQKPITVANFLNYVRSGRYDGTIVHRKTDLNTDGLGVILAFVGTKMLLSYFAEDWFHDHFPTWLSLAVIIVVLAATSVVSVAADRRSPVEPRTPSRLPRRWTGFRA